MRSCILHVFEVSACFCRVGTLGLWGLGVLVGASLFTRFSQDVTVVSSQIKHLIPFETIIVLRSLLFTTSLHRRGFKTHLNPHGARVVGLSEPFCDSDSEPL